MGLTLGDGAAGEVIVDDVAVGSMAAQLGLLPGAALVALNEVPIAGLTRKAVIVMIGKAKRPLTLHVRPGVVPGVVTHPSVPAGSRAVVGAVEVAKGDAKDGGSPSTAPSSDLDDIKERQRRERLVKQKNEGDERRLRDELRAESMSKRMSHRGVRSDHQGVQALRLRSDCALSAL